MKSIRRLNKEKVLTILFCLLIMAMYVYRFAEQKMPIVLLDEFGYWSTGAFFSGYQWSEIAKFNSYYSYGYGIVLGLLIRLFGKSDVLYQSAITVNMLMLIGTFLLSKRIIKKLYPQIGGIKAVMAAFIAASYPSNYSNMHIAWAELFLTFLYTLSVFILLKYILTGRIRYLYLWVVNVFSLYIVHQRALGIVVSAVIVLFLLGLKGAVSKKQIVFCGVGLMLLFCLHKCVKAAIVDQVMIGEVNTMADVNDYATIFSHIRHWFNLEGFRKVFISLGGKITYLMISSCSLLGIAFYAVLGAGKDFFDKKAFDDVGTNFINFYLLLSLISTMLISSIYTLDGRRMDTLIYGRYTEWCVGPWILVALGTLYSRRASGKIVFINLAVSFVMVLGGRIVYADHPEWIEYGYAFVCAPVCFLFYKNCVNDQFLYIGILITTLVYLMLTLPHIIYKKNKKAEIVGMAGMLGMYLLFGKMLIDRTLESNYRSELVLDMHTQIENIDDSACIYYIKDEGQTIWYVADLQVYDVNKKVIAVENQDNAELIKDHSYFLILDTYSEYGKELSQTMQPLATNWQVSLYYFDGER